MNVAWGVQPFVRATPPMSAADEVIAATERLLGAVAANDYATYEALSDASLTCVEPETHGQIVVGLAFHKHFFGLKPATAGNAGSDKQNIVCRPLVRMLGPDHALIVYVRITQNAGKVSLAEETRVWRRDTLSKQWKNVHFHRSSRL